MSRTIRVYASLLCLSAASTGLPLSRSGAQTPAWLGGQSPEWFNRRLSVDPRTMATGTKNPAAGEYLLWPDSSAIVSVPPQCVGHKRCPLLLQMPGGGQPTWVMTGWMRPVADKYGFILLTVSGTILYNPSTVVVYSPAYVDTTLKEVLRRFAIDPTKLAIAGRCASGLDGILYGIQNLRVFSRIISVSGGVAGIPMGGEDRMDRTNKTAQFLIDRSYHEIPDNFMGAQALRRDGHPVTVMLGIRDHDHQAEDYDYVGHWLMQSWALPNPAKRPAPQVVSDPLPVLTSEVLAKLTTFWARFAQEPESVRLAGRRAHLHEVVLPVGQERPVTWMTNMVAFAAQSPAVAADLARAGLTAQQHDAYRLALLSAITTSIGLAAEGGGVIGTVDPTSVLAKNVAFVRTHPDEVKALASVGATDNTAGIGGCCTKPAEVDKAGPLGIWRTP